MFLVEEELDCFFLDDVNNNSDEQLMDTNENIEIKCLSQKMAERYNLLTQAYFKLYLKLKDKYLIARYKCDEIFNDIESIVKINNNHLLDIISKCEERRYESSKIIEIVKANLNDESIFEEVHRISKLESSKNDWLLSSNFFVKPKQIDLPNDKSFQYIPILKTLKSLFANKEICEAYFKSIEKKQHNTGTISSFNDSVFFKQNKLFSSDPTAIQLVMYDDAYDSANPLGDRRLEKLNDTYFRIGNLDNCYQSIDYLTQASIICKTKHLKKHGYNTIYEPLLKDIKQLETEGIEIEYNQKKINLKGTISLFPADNLAANAIGGYVESFSANCK